MALSKRLLALTAIVAQTMVAFGACAGDSAPPPYTLHWMQGGGGRLGAVWFHRQGDSLSGPGVELTFGQSLVAEAGPLYLGVSQEHVLRVLDSKSVAFSFTLYTLTTGARLGPLEPFASVGVASLTLDVFHGDYSAELFAPRIAAGVAAYVTRAVRIVFAAHSEYLWRWFGPDYRLRGVAIGIEVLKPSR